MLSAGEGTDMCQQPEEGDVQSEETSGAFQVRQKSLEMVPDARGGELTDELDRVALLLIPMF